MEMLFVSERIGYNRDRGDEMILYYTGTGNSLALARILGEEIGEKPLPLAKCLEEHMWPVEDEALYLVMPVYFWGVPHLVEEFLKEAKIESEYIALILTMGSSTGYAMRDVESLLARQGKHLDATVAVRMPDNYVLAFNPPTEDKAEVIRTEGETHFRTLVPRLAKREHFIEDKPGFGRFLYPLVRRFYENGRSTAKFYAKKNCIGCENCSHVCGVHAIEIREERPVWVKETCEHCLACIHQCPVRAIEYGRMTKRRRRYVHPNFRMKLSARRLDMRRKRA